MCAPLVSIIMPSYNAARYIEESIRSIRAQSTSKWELIIVDDCSTDGTRDIVSNFQRLDTRIRLFCHSVNRGPADARNLGLDKARGDYVAFIDSDDVWSRDKIMKQVDLMERCGADISYTGYRRRDDDKLSDREVLVPERVTYNSMLRRNQIACSSAMIRRSTCGQVRMPRVRRRQDHGYWLALLRDGTRVAVAVREPLVRYRVHRESLSSNKLTAAMYTWRLLRNVEKFGFARSLWLFGGYAFEAIKLRLQLRIQDRDHRSAGS